MSKKKEARRHPLEGLPGFARYLRSEQIAFSADLLVAAWAPLRSPEHLERAERFMYQYVTGDDLLSFPWERELSDFEDLELATYNYEALSMHTLATRWAVASGVNTLVNVSKFKDTLRRFMGDKRQNVRQEDEAYVNVYLLTKIWLESAQPELNLRRDRIKDALNEERRSTRAEGPNNE